MSPTVYSKGKIESDQVPITLINMSNDVIHAEKHTLIGSLKLYADCQEIQKLKIHQLVVEQQEDVMSCVSCLNDDETALCF